MSDDLRERVARRLALDTEGSDEWWTLYMRRADAAIAIIRPHIRNETLEEAARVADDEAGHCEDTGSAPSDFGNAGRNDAAQTIAAAIRALKDKP